MPESPVPFFTLAHVRLDESLPLPELLRSVERQIARAPVEVAFSFGTNGQLLLRRVGSETSIRFPRHELDLMKNAILTHNHPGRGYFSKEDLLFAQHFNLAQFNVVAGRYVHQLLRPHNHWDALALETFWEFEERKIIRQFQQDRNRMAARTKRNALALKAVKALSLTVITELL